MHASHEIPGMFKDVLVEREVLQKVGNRFIVNLLYAWQDNDNISLVLTLCPGGAWPTQRSAARSWQLHATAPAPPGPRVQAISRTCSSRAIRAPSLLAIKRATATLKSCRRSHLAHGDLALATSIAHLNRELNPAPSILPVRPLAPHRERSRQSVAAGAAAR